MHYDAIRSEFEKSLTKHPHMTTRGLFRRLGGVVSHLAINLMDNEKRSVDPNECDHALRTGHGLPCACEMQNKLVARRTISPNNDIHIFWTTLHMGEESEIEQPSVREMFDEWARDRRESASEDELRSYYESADSSTGYQYEHMDEPTRVSTKGRNSNAIGRRIPCSWEKKIHLQTLPNKQIQVRTRVVVGHSCMRDRCHHKVSISLEVGAMSLGTGTVGLGS